MCIYIYIFKKEHIQEGTLINFSWRSPCCSQMCFLWVCMCLCAIFYSILPTSFPSLFPSMLLSYCSSSFLPSLVLSFLPSFLPSPFFPGVPGTYIFFETALLMSPGIFKPKKRQGSVMWALFKIVPEHACTARLPSTTKAKKTPGLVGVMCAMANLVATSNSIHTKPRIFFGPMGPFNHPTRSRLI